MRSFLVIALAFVTGCTKGAVPACEETDTMVADTDSDSADSGDTDTGTEDTAVDTDSGDTDPVNQCDFEVINSDGTAVHMTNAIIVTLEPSPFPEYEGGDFILHFELADPSCPGLVLSMQSFDVLIDAVSGEQPDIQNGVGVSIYGMNWCSSTQDCSTWPGYRENSDNDFASEQWDNQELNPRHWNVATTDNYVVDSTGLYIWTQVQTIGFPATDTVTVGLTGIALNDLVHPQTYTLVNPGSVTLPNMPWYP